MKTLKLIIFILLVLYTTISVAQTNTVSFAYDNSGNRIKREIIIPKSSKINSNANLDTALIAVKPFTEKLGEMKITIYPNPTKGQLSVGIANLPTNTYGEVRIYNAAGNIIQYQKTIGTLNRFDFSSYSTGIYFLEMKIGQNVTKWKIIKQ